jgi:hypothetical protein
MPISFPTSPAVDDTYVFSGITWQWNGRGWARVGRGGTEYYAYKIQVGIIVKTLTVDPVAITHT